MIKKPIVKFLIFSLILTFSTNFLAVPMPTHAATLSELQKQAELYRQQMAASQIQANQKKQDAALLNKVITKINTDINTTQAKINEAQSQINDLSGQIIETSGQIEQKQKELEFQQSLQQEAIRTLYIDGDEDPMNLLLTNKSFTALIEQNNYLESLETKVETTITQVNSLKKDLESQKSQLEQQKGSLELYKSQQESNQSQLSSQKSQKNQLLTSTNTQLQSYLNNVTDLQKKVAALQKQIDSLIATSAWGSDIISANDSTWYYSQLDYQNHLGSSPYTVAQYGCMITSIAMVATYYGHHITPANIADDDSLFDSQGNFRNSYPDYLGVNSIGKTAVNWNTVNNDLSSGNPVILSVYIPQIGAINADGSTHFIVVKSFSNGKYMMHDPIGSGRGYAISQVRSMLRLRPN